MSSSELVSGQFRKVGEKETTREKGNSRIHGQAARACSRGYWKVTVDCVDEKGIGKVSAQCAVKVPLPTPQPLPQ